MSFPVYESAQYDSAPPIYTASSSIPMSNVHPTVTPSAPPAYDSLPDIPIWSVPMTANQSNTSPGDLQWSFFPQIPPYEAFSSSPPQQTPQLTTSARRKRTFRKWRQGYVAVLQLLSAFTEVAAGTILASNEFAYLSKALSYGAPFWAPVCYLITGCLLLTVTYIKPTPCRIRLSFSFNILTLAVGSAGLVFNVEDLGRLCGPEIYQCYVAQLNTYKMHYVLISMNVVMMSLSIFAAVIGFVAWCCVSRDDPEPSVIENEYATSLPPPDFFPTTPLPPPPPYAAHEGCKVNTTM